MCQLQLLVFSLMSKMERLCGNLLDISENDLEWCRSHRTSASVFQDTISAALCAASTCAHWCWCLLVKVVMSVPTSCGAYLDLALPALCRRPGDCRRHCGTACQLCVAKHLVLLATRFIRDSLPPPTRSD